MAELACSENGIPEWLARVTGGSIDHVRRIELIFDVCEPVTARVYKIVERDDLDTSQSLEGIKVEVVDG